MSDEINYIELLNDVYSQIRTSISEDPGRSAEGKASAVFDTVMTALKECAFLGKNTALFIPSRFKLKSGSRAALLDTSCHFYNYGYSESDYALVYKSFILYYLMVVRQDDGEKGMGALLNEKGKLQEDFFCLVTHNSDRSGEDDRYVNLNIDKNELYDKAFDWISNKCSVSQINGGHLKKLQILEGNDNVNINALVSRLADECNEDKEHNVNRLKSHIYQQATDEQPYQFINLAYYSLKNDLHFNYYFPTIVTTVQSTDGDKSAPGVLVLSTKDKLNEDQISFLKVLSNIIWKTVSQIDIVELEKQAVDHARKAANISILVDSFSHNVAAHSLTALSQYFANRKSILEKESITKELFHQSSTTPVLTNEQIEEIKSLVDKKEDRLTLAEVIKKGGEDVLSNMLSLVQEGYDSVKLPVSIDDSIYYFINYLYEKAEFWSAVIAGESFSHSIENMYELISGFVNNPMFLGTLASSERLNKIKFSVSFDDCAGKEFACVDFSVLQEREDGKKKTPYKRNYQFVKEGTDYDDLKDKLKEKRVWLPGGNVGRQAIYTIFENCIRNIKHYDIEKIRAEGIINFHLDIKGPTDDKFNLKIYLGHSDYYDGKTAEKIVEEVNAKIQEGTFDYKNSLPVMGGTSQSILCAHQLLTGKFSPNSKDGSGNYVDKPFQVCQKNGYVAYTFKLWEGENRKIISNSEEIKSVPNLSRFEFLVAKPDSVDLIDLKRQASDMVRVLESNQENYQEIYKEWLKKWLGDKKFSNGIQLTFDSHNLQAPDSSTNKIEFLHGEVNSANLHFRNHGVFVKKIKSNWENCKYDVMESVLTGIYAVDDRLNNVWDSKINKSEFRTELLLNIKGESDSSALKDDWVNLRNGDHQIRDTVNFLIVHLSFIEKLSQDFKDDINKFVRIVKKTVGDRENFHLVITTGRGRSEWKESIEDELKSFVKYRSVFSMQKALINAAMIDDDFDAKYNLTKVLFGS